MNEQTELSPIAEAIHIAICEGSPKDCVEWRGRCVKAAEAAGLPQEVSEFIDEIGERHLESCVAAGECPWCAVYFKYATKETR